MQRLWYLAPIVAALAACSGAPTRQQASADGKALHTTGRSAGSVHAWGETSPYLPRFIDHSVGEEEVSIQAMSLVGVPYRWGGNTPQGGFDCSGLVKYVVSRAADVDLPRTTEEMSLSGVSIGPDEVAPGDLIFFNTTGRAHSHVGIYVGASRFVNAPSTGGTVRIDYVTNPYWAKRFDGIRRVASVGVRPVPANAPMSPDGAPSRVVAPDTAIASASGAIATSAVAAASTAGAGRAPAGAAATSASASPTYIGATPMYATAASSASHSSTVSVANVTNTSDQHVVQEFLNGTAAGAAAESTGEPAARTAYAPAAAAPSASLPLPASPAHSADAFEPPPPTAREAAAQSRAPAFSSADQYGAAAPRTALTTTGSDDDPIARFAHGGSF